MGVVGGPYLCRVLLDIKITFPIDSTGKFMSVLSPNLKNDTHENTEFPTVKNGRGPYLCMIL